MAAAAMIVGPASPADHFSPGVSRPLKTTRRQRAMIVNAVPRSVLNRLECGLALRVRAQQSALPLKKWSYHSL